MAGPSDTALATYLDARPRYPSEWFSKLASVTPQRSLAWDVGTGNGEAALGDMVKKHWKYPVPEIYPVSTNLQVTRTEEKSRSSKYQAKPHWRAREKMAGPYDTAAATYSDARPAYPSEWFSKLASLTPQRSLAWDVGTGNGQAALGVAEHYDRVIATDVSEEQLKHAPSHPRIQYKHTPLSMTDDEIVNIIGGEDSVDLVTVGTAVHWFNLETFYSIVKRVLKKPGGIIAVWTYGLIEVSPEFDLVLQRFSGRAAPFRDPKTRYAFDCYRTLPFPFESVGWGRKGEPVVLEMSKETSFEGLIRLLRTWSAVNTAKDQGVDLLTQDVVREFEQAWGGTGAVRTVIYKTYMIAGRVK